MYAWSRTGVGTLFGRRAKIFLNFDKRAGLCECMKRTRVHFGYDMNFRVHFGYEKKNCLSFSHKNQFCPKIMVISKKKKKKKKGLHLNSVS